MYTVHIHVYNMYISTRTAEQDEFGVSSYGISVATMEEVFMKVQEGAEETLRHRYHTIAIACTCNIQCRLHVQHII